MRQEFTGGVFIRGKGMEQEGRGRGDRPLDTGVAEEKRAEEREIETERQRWQAAIVHRWCS